MAKPRIYRVDGLPSGPVVAGQPIDVTLVATVRPALGISARASRTVLPPTDDSINVGLTSTATSPDPVVLTQLAPLVWRIVL